MNIIRLNSLAIFRHKVKEVIMSIRRKRRSRIDEANDLNPAFYPYLKRIIGSGMPEYEAEVRHLQFSRKDAAILRL